MTRAALVAAYLGAIVAANLTLAEWGRAHPEVALYNAFAFIGLDLVARDSLHDAWHHQLARRMVHADRGRLAYSQNARHEGAIYRFDGWTLVTDKAGSSGGGTYSTKRTAGDAVHGRKRLWLWALADATMRPSPTLGGTP